MSGKTVVLQSPLVGAHFRPPAKQVLAALPSEAELILVEEPDNPYDGQAIKVLVDCATALQASQGDAMAAALEGTGTDIAELLAGPIQIGYVISATNKKLGSWSSNAQVKDLLQAGPCRASLGWSPSGEPLVITRQELEGKDQ